MHTFDARLIYDNFSHRAILITDYSERMLIREKKLRMRVSQTSRNCGPHAAVRRNYGIFEKISARYFNFFFFSDSSKF